MNSTLESPLSKEEIKVALFQMFPIKASGPDGYLAHFFQRHWDLCGDEVCDVVLRVLKGEDDLSLINNTYVFDPEGGETRRIRVVLSHQPVQCHLQDSLKIYG
jgi:hypothetical protein